MSDKNAESSDEVEAPTRSAAAKAKSRNAAAARNQRVEKISEKEERERLRAETANKRKGRAERRRADGMLLPTRAEVSGTHTHADSDPSEEMPLAARASANKAIQPPVTSTAIVPATTEVVRPPPVAELAPTSNPAPDTPPTITVQNKAADKKRSHKKKGRNQYTRDRDANDDESPARSQSRDIQKDEHGPPASSGKAVAETSSGKAHLKPRGGMSSKVTMTDMRRKASALLDYISRTQVDLAGETLPGNNTDAAGSVNGSSTSGSENPPNGASGIPALLLEPAADDRPERDFKDLGCMEMMDSLTRRLVKWQQQYAV